VLRGEHSLTVLDNSVLKKIYGPNREEAISRRMEKTA
jgi:hypothetical protein